MYRAVEANKSSPHKKSIELASYEPVTKKLGQINFVRPNVIWPDQFWLTDLVWADQFLHPKLIHQFCPTNFSVIGRTANIAKNLQL